MSAPTRVDYSGELAAIAALPTGWSDGAGLPISAVCIERARRALLIFSLDPNRWIVEAQADGGVRMSQDSGSELVAIEFSVTGDIEVIQRLRDENGTTTSGERRRAWSADHAAEIVSKIRRTR